MTLKLQLEQFRSDLDDENNLDITYFTDIQLVQFLMRAYREVNNKIKCATKYNYINFTENINVYDMPTDFIDFHKMIDYRNQTSLTYAEYNFDRNNNNFTQSTYYHTNQTIISNPYFMFQIDANRKKMIFNYIPDSSYNEVHLVKAQGTNYITVATGSYWFDPVIVKVSEVADATKINYMRVTKIESTTVDSVACMKLYLSETNILDGTALTGYTTDSWNAYLVDMGLEYVYEPTDLFTKYSGKNTSGTKYTVTYVANAETITITSLSLALATALQSALSIGNGLYIEGYGTKVISNISSLNGNILTLTLEEPMSESYGFTTDSFYIIDLEEQINIPIELHELVIVIALYYASMRASQADVNNYLAKSQNILQEYLYRQNGKTLNMINNRKKGYDDSQSFQKNRISNM